MSALDPPQDPAAGLRTDYGQRIPRQQILLIPLLPILGGVVLMVLLGLLTLSDPPPADPGRTPVRLDPQAAQRFKQVARQAEALAEEGRYEAALDLYIALPREVSTSPLVARDLEGKRIVLLLQALDRAHKEARALADAHQTEQAAARAREVLARPELADGPPPGDPRFPKVLDALRALTGDAPE